jgi:DNA-binding NarL/FixJ family response regulator
MDRARILIVDDHAFWAEAVQELLPEDYALVGAVTDGADVLDAIAQTNPTVVLTDISMPKADGFTLLKQVKTERPDMCVIVLTNSAEPELARAALRYGAAGYVLKVYAPDDLVEAIGEALAGRTFISPALGRSISGTPRS